MKNLAELRRNYSLKTLDEKDVAANPQLQFEEWLQEAIESEEAEPNAMCLSTCTTDGKPSSRIVLLKQFKKARFVFFTNYESHKGKQIEQNPYCALNFVWLGLERQVRIEGIVEKLSAAESDSYFEVRPQGSKLGAWSSPQSEVIPNRECLEQAMEKFEAEFEGKTITRPSNWGGYIVKPHLIEFWQGRSNRIHDRICYTLQNGYWKIERLAP